MKFTVTVMITGTGTPLRSVGENSHCLTASSAAWSRSGMDRRTFASWTWPFGPIEVREAFLERDESPPRRGYEVIPPVGEEGDGHVG